MEKCVHVSKIRPAWDHSILNPEKWLCYICRTTESVWACLSCSNVACGRFNEQHALKHYQESKHPISIEVNEKYVYCYACDDYVLNDNAAGDIKLLRSALSAVTTQKFTDIESRGRRLLRSYSHNGVVQREEADEEDKAATAEWHRRQRLLVKVFGAWRLLTKREKSVKRKSSDKEMTELLSSSGMMFKKTRITPGVTGLKNLGNTCYMNSVLQILSHIDAFREFFLRMRYVFDTSPDGSPLVKRVVVSQPAEVTPPAAKQYTRQTTVECFQHLMSHQTWQTTPPSKKKLKGGLNGGSAQSTSSPVKQHLICDVESLGNSDTTVSLCGELHGLLRVLWSGRWAQVSPHAFLRAVWQDIPMFKGYAQHDAQEFLCELLDKIQRELDSSPGQPSSKLLDSIFQGQLVSKVQCLSCKKVSETYEPYMDLSLEFPNRYQITKQNSRVAEDICHITEMLAKFTEEENLEGKIYACENCNKSRSKASGMVYTEAKKQLLINKLPPVLRLHLKRFRWSGRLHREKISTHVATDEQLDLRPFCVSHVDPSSQYHLFGLIIHHGRGFGSGHYTAYTWNKEAGSWVHCNDSRMILTSMEEVLSAQAYILFYKAVNNQGSFPVPLLEPDSQGYTLSSQDTQQGGYSLTSQATVMLGTRALSNMQPIVPMSPSSFSSLEMPKLEKETLSSSTSTEKYSLKVDGTQILDSVEMLDSSVILNDSLKYVDPEISFNFRTADSGDKRMTRSASRAMKRSLENLKDSENVQKARKLSFETQMFYNSPKTDKTNHRKTAATVNSDKKRRRSHSFKLDSSPVLKLEKYIGRSHAEDEKETAHHVKR